MTERSFRDVEYNYKLINERIAEAAEKSGRRREDITLLAATKTVDAQTINHAISLGLDHIGENRVQELLSKYEQYDLEHCSLQFIGHLQTNKVRQIVDKVDLIQSVDSFKLAKEISNQSLKRDKVTDILVEVNIGREENKSGVFEENLEELLCQISELKEKKREKIENTSSVTTWARDKKRIIIEPRPNNGEKPALTTAETTVEPTASTAAPTTKPTEPPTTEQPTTAEPTTEATTTAPTASWKQAYIDYVNNADKFFTLFSLIDIDGDDIPELFSATEASKPVFGTRICFMDGDTIKEEGMGASLYYAEGQGLLLTSTTMSGSQMVEVETFSDGKVTAIHSGTRNMKDECKWDDKDLSLDEYNSTIKDYTDNMIQPKTVGKSEIISMIEAY